MHTLFLWLRTLLNLDFTVKFDMAFAFEADIEFSRIVGRGPRRDFFEAKLLFGLSFELPRSMNKLTSFRRFFLPALRKLKQTKDLDHEHSPRPLRNLPHP
jgi:hypothetical protein